MLDHGHARLLMLGAVLACASPAATAQAGRIVFAIGDVWLEAPDEAREPARAGTAVAAGETISTGANGRAQVRFRDGGFVSLVPASGFRVDEYEFGGEAHGAGADDGDRGLFSLLRGGLRAVTGAIGRLNEDAYRMRTGLATIGIRGTSFRARLCAGDCAAPDGLYVSGGSGVVFVANDFGTRDLGAGTSAYVADAFTPPVYTTTEPEVGAPSADAPAVAEAEAEGEDEAAGDAVAAATETEAPEFDFSRIVFSAQSPVVRTITLAGPSAGAGFAFASQEISFPAGTPDAGDTFESGAFGGGGLLESGAEVDIGFGEDGGVLLFAVRNTVGNSAVFRAASVADAGGVGSLFWGRWANTDLEFQLTSPDELIAGEAAIPGPGGIHYIAGTPAATLPGGGTATYTFAGGTRSTSPTGVSGAGVTAGTLTANFGAGNVAASFTVHHDGMYSASGVIPLLAPDPDFEGTISAHGAGGGAASCAGCPVEVGGFFSGNQPVPGDAGIAYEIQHQGGVLGAAGFACTSGC